MSHRIFSKSVHLLCDEQCTKIIFNALEGNYALCLLGELVCELCLTADAPQHHPNE